MVIEQAFYRALDPRSVQPFMTHPDLSLIFVCRDSRWSITSHTQVRSVHHAVSMTRRQQSPCGIGDRSYTLPQTSQWFVLCTRIRSFCVNAGSPDLVGDPLLNIGRLREYTAGKKMFGTAEFLEKINELQEKSREQQSIIASLSFRYLLEKLPPDGTESATMKWKQFWDIIWNNCQPQNADLRDLVEKYRDKKLKNKGKKSEDTGMKLKGKGKKELKDNYLDHVNEVARGMYNTLSTNIHHYSGDVDLSKSSPWNRVQRDILKFLMPEAGLNADLDWDAERKRLGYIAEKKNNEEKQEVQKKELDEEEQQKKQEERKRKKAEKEKEVDEVAEMPKFLFESVSSHC